MLQGGRIVFGTEDQLAHGGAGNRGERFVGGAAVAFEFELDSNGQAVVQLGGTGEEDFRILLHVETGVVGRASGRNILVVVVVVVAEADEVVHVTADGDFDLVSRSGFTGDETGSNQGGRSNKKLFHNFPSCIFGSSTDHALFKL